MKTYIIKTDGKDFLASDVKVLENLDQLKSVANEYAVLVLKSLIEKPSTQEEIAKKLKLDKKKVYSAIKTLEKTGMIEVISSSNKKGIITNNYKSLASSFALEVYDQKKRLDLREKSINNENVAKFYRKFIKDGKFNGYICVGSPDPHGEYKAISRDTHFAIYLGMYLGQFCELPKVFPIKLDTDIIGRNMFKENLILIGGPVTNLITRDVNTFLPLKFVKEEGWMLKGKTGLHGRDYEGTIEKIHNPFDKSKDLIIIGGIRNTGTLAAMLGATRFADSTFRAYNDEAAWYTVVRGYDIDGDGEIDSVETAK